MLRQQWSIISIKTDSSTPFVDDLVSENQTPVPTPPPSPVVLGPVSPFRTFTVKVSGIPTTVSLDRSLLDDSEGPREVDRWVTKNATAAIMLKADGKDKVAGGLLSGRFTWVKRKAEADGSVTIQAAD